MRFFWPVLAVDGLVWFAKRQTSLDIARMNATVLVAIISASAAMAVAALSYSFNKRSERESQWRKLKLDHYKEFVSALSAAVSLGASSASRSRYSDSVNLMTLVASPSVLRALYEFLDEICVPDASKSQQRHLAALAALFLEIRADIHPEIPDDTGIPFRLVDGLAPVNRDNGGVT